MVKMNDLNISRIFYNNIDISDLYYNQEKYFKRCICDCSQGGEDPENPSDDFGQYINTYNTRELMLDSLIGRQDDTTPFGTIPQSLYKYTALDDCFVYNTYIPLSLMNFAEHDNVVSHWFIPLVIGNEEIEYVDLYVDHNLVKRYRNLQAAEYQREDSRNLLYAGSCCDYVYEHWQYNPEFFSYIVPITYNREYYGIYIDYADVANAQKLFLSCDAFTISNKSSLQEFRSYNYSSSFYMTGKGKYTNGNTYDILYLAFAPVTINVKYKNNFTKAYRYYSNSELIDASKDNNTIFLPHYEMLSGNCCLTAGGYSHYTSTVSLQINYPVNMQEIYFWNPKEASSYEYYTDFTANNILHRNKAQFMVPPKINRILITGLLLSHYAFETDLYCLTERPQNIEFVDYSRIYSDSKGRTFNIYCKEEWKNNYIDVVENLNNLTSEVTFNLKTF